MDVFKEAVWIDPELPHSKDERQPASVLRRSFTVSPAEKTGDPARLFITCHGLYEAKINGSRVGDFILAPGCDNYKKRLQYQVYDVSELLRTGENLIEVTLGDGWYRGNVGIDGICNYYGNDLALLCRLALGDRTVLVSDESWEASQSGPVRLNDLQKGEEYDARMETPEDWHGVTLREWSRDILVGPEGCVPVIEQERFEGRLIKTPNGETVIDFGQNLAGYVEMKLDASEGQKITLWHGETLDENGNFTQKNFDPGDRNKNGGIPQRIDYICRDGLNTYKPHFAIFGFRYAKIETDADLSGAEFTSVAVYSRMPQTGFFECGNSDVNRLFENALWSMRSNFCDIPTDCPTRERAGWTGDAGVFAPTGLMLADCAPVLRKWLAECRIEQREDGLVENIAPVNNSGSMISNMLQGAAGWGDACVIVPWEIYSATGDTSVLEENYGMMTGWLGFCLDRASKTRIKNRKNPYRKYLVDHGFHFGEWCEPDVNNMQTMKQNMTNGAPEVATAYLHRSADLLSRIAGVLGKDKDAEKYAEIAESSKQAYRYTCTCKGKIDSKRQAEYVRPIAFGLLDGDEVKEAADTLNELVTENGYHLNTGFLATPFLLPVLAENGHADTAYRLLLQEDRPGWLYSVKKGATTIWETWDGIDDDGKPTASLNHYSYGAVAGWCISGICGINAGAEGIVIRPFPNKELKFADAALDSRFGRIESGWKYENGKLSFDILVPEGASAVLMLPGREAETIGPGSHHYEE
ncbi:MAG: family 78 glycoside hydrolase catalytic domain [Oscillospiraceae bacterium]|nr:family 78 glycoside hydrolase catalytic domain [Oscillospiraceae bacterium]